MTHYTPRATFPTVELALAAAPAHRVPLKQIAKNLRDRPVDLVAVGNIMPGRNTYPVAFALTSDAILVGKQMPFGLRDMEERPRTPLDAIRFDDGTTDLIFPAFKEPLPYTFDDHVALDILRALRPDADATFDTSPILPRRDHTDYKQAVFNADVRSMRLKIILFGAAAIAVLFIIGSYMN